MFSIVRTAEVVQTIDPSASWALIVGAVTPFLIAVINNPRYSNQLRQVIAVGVSLLVGIMTVIVGGFVLDWTLSLPNILFIISAVVGAAQAFYSLVWKPTGTAARVEAATSKDTELVAVPVNQATERGYISIAGALVIAILVVLFVWLVTTLL